MVYGTIVTLLSVHWGGITNYGGAQKSATLMLNRACLRTFRRHLCTPSANKEALEFLAARGRALGMPLSLSERELIIREVERLADRNGKMFASDWERLVTRRSLVDHERLTLSEFLIKGHDLHLGQHLLKRTARLGISFFALCSAHTAGESGMHVVGSVLVGCVAALGGGTINNLLVGATPVGWTKDTSYVVAAIAASLVGFYLWPFAELAKDDSQILKTKLDLIPAEIIPKFESKTYDEKGTSPVRYALESVALGALAVVGAQQGIVKGLHPLASSCLGVSVALGGVMRDVMCQRDVVLGSHSGCQSYAVASFSASATYVILRQIHVWNCAGSSRKLLHGGIPIGVRIFLGVSTAIVVRVCAWQQKPDAIFLDMHSAAASNYEKACNLLNVGGSRD